MGETYNVGGNAERTNITVVKAICALLDERRPLPDGRARESLITYVKDRPGHDRRYALDVGKLERLGWRSRHPFSQAIEKTVRWYAENAWWWRPIKSGELYQAYYAQQYGKRLGEKAERR